MNELYDKNPIYDIKLEAYIGYGQNDLLKMNKSELEKELVKVNQKIKETKQEIDETGSFPSYVIKEEILNLENRRNKIKDMLENFSYNEGFVDKEIERLTSMLESGTISEEQHSIYINKLNDSRTNFKDFYTKESVKEYKKQPLLKRFKKSLLSYKK